jgi:hypothetical protein
VSSPAKLLRLADGSYHPLGEQVSTIGRDQSLEICIPLSAISRTHAQIERTPHGYSIRDLDSRNGSFVNGVRLESTAIPLRDGDEIVLAGVETFRFVDPMGTPAAPAIGRLTGVWIDPDSRAVWVDAQRLEPPLSSRQQILLELLDANVGSMVPRSEIVDVVWADVAADGVSAEAVDALIKRLRARLRPLQIHGDYLEVRRGRGVRLNPGHMRSSGAARGSR